MAQSGCNLVNAAVDCFNVAAEDKNILTSGCRGEDKAMMVIDGADDHVVLVGCDLHNCDSFKPV